MRGDKDVNTTDRLKILATLASVSTALIILMLKSYAYVVTHSMAMMAGVLDSAMDVLVSVSMAYAMFHAIRPPDVTHRFGHGKAEGLASLFQACFMIGAAMVLGYQSVIRFFTPIAIEQEVIGMGITVTALFLTGVLVSFQSYVVCKTASLGITSDSLHYKGDILMNIGVLIALAGSYYTSVVWFDGLFGIGVAVYFIYNGAHILKNAIDVLMDRELAQSKRDSIKSCVKSHPKVHAIHDLRTRSTGGQYFIEFHLEMDGALTLIEAHDIAHEVEDKLKLLFNNAVVTIHQEPSGIKDNRLDNVIRKKKPS